MRQAAEDAAMKAEHRGDSPLKASQQAPLSVRHRVHRRLDYPAALGLDRGARLESANMASQDLLFFADRAAKKWPLRGSLKLG
jgi:hypothetical protein